MKIRCMGMALLAALALAFSAGPAMAADSAQPIKIAQLAGLTGVRRAGLGRNTGRCTHVTQIGGCRDGFA